MKKNGFTLAEVLITLTIIGVIASLTLPALTTNIANAKIGPSLSTAVSNFEQANSNMLQATGLDNIQSLFGDGGANAEPYLRRLQNFLNGSSDGTTLTTKNGFSYSFDGEGSKAGSTEDITKRSDEDAVKDVKDGIIDRVPPHRTYVAHLMIDINGTAGPNRNGRDRFHFGLFRDGSLRPAGGAQRWAYGTEWDKKTWQRNCKNDSTVNNEAAMFCTGSIFANDMKVKYTVQAGD